jgi:hypothetical protein
MNSPRFVVAAALLLTACGRPPAAPSHEPRFAIELPGSSPVHVLVFDRGGTSSRFPFSLLTGTSWRARTPDQPETLQLFYSAEGDRAHIVSYAIYDASRKKLGDHRARLNESVKLTELQNLGYLPFSLRVVSGTPPARPMPVVSSDAPDEQEHALEVQLHGVKSNEGGFLNQFKPGGRPTLAQFWAGINGIALTSVGSR